MSDVRPMREADVPGVQRLALATFADLDRRLGIEGPPPPSEPERGRIRLRRLLATDPGGAWVAERDGALAGCALALVRGGLWGLSLLVVAPGCQSGGLGRELLARAYAHGGAAVRGRVVLASLDPRALRSYARLGLTAHPCLRAVGVPQGVQAPSGVREGTPDDLPLTEAVDRHVRGVPHGADIAAQLEAGMSLLVAPERGYAVTDQDEVRLLAATDEGTAQDLLRAALGRAGARRMEVGWLTAAQAWAVRVCVEARLELSAGGVVFLAGEVGPFRPYIPSGAYL
jgi:GNAT superfamily N-acetyltransferase